MTPWQNDTEYNDETLSEVTETPNHWAISFESGGSIGVAKGQGPAVPRVGSSVRLFGKGFGFPVRGIVIDGEVAHYKTKAEHEAQRDRDTKDSRQRQRDEFEAERAERDGAYDALPEVFRRRIAMFRRTNPDFRWEHEPHELFSCQQAVIMAEGLGEDEFAAFRELSFAQKKMKLPELSDDHWGNTLGVALVLARAWAKEPNLVLAQHGALTPLVGCKDYGCPHPRSASPIAGDQREALGLPAWLKKA